MAIELEDHKYAVALNNRGIVYFNLKKYRRAIEDFNEALMLSPFYEHAYNNRGATYLRSGDTDRAIADFRRALEIDDNYLDAHKHLAEAYLGRLDSQAAVAELKRALVLTVDPSEKKKLADLIARIESSNAGPK
jgi:tetratricopeptide (TPR) repeat protein